MLNDKENFEQIESNFINNLIKEYQDLGYWNEKLEFTKLDKKKAKRGFPLSKLLC